MTNALGNEVFYNDYFPFCFSKQFNEYLSFPIEVREFSCLHFEKNKDIFIYCKNDYYCQGLCKKHYNKFIREKNKILFTRKEEISNNSDICENMDQSIETKNYSQSKGKRKNKLQETSAADDDVSCFYNVSSPSSSSSDEFNLYSPTYSNDFDSPDSTPNYNYETDESEYEEELIICKLSNLLIE